MKNALLVIWVAGIVGVGITPAAAADAAPKKNAATAKKHTVRTANMARVKKTFHGRTATRGASLVDASHLAVHSSAALVLDQATGKVLYEKNPGAVLPIASITKLMTAMVVLDAKPDLKELLEIGVDDIDTVKGTRSKLSVGTQLEREEMLRLALMSSENRAASALSRHYPGGRDAFMAAMNAKAKSLRLLDTRFEDPTGLTAANVSSPRDLAKMVDAAHQYPLIREFSTATEGEVSIAGRSRQFRNTNTLVKNRDWEIGLSKTGYISEAGKCLVMQAWLNNKPTIIVLLDSWGRLTRVGDANRIKRWIESAALTSDRLPG